MTPKVNVEYYTGLQDGISFAYNLGIEDAELDTAAAMEARGLDYSKGFIEGFETVRAKIFNQDKETLQ